MSETMKTLVESLAMIGAITGSIVWYAKAADRREGGEARSTDSSTPAQIVFLSKKVTTTGTSVDPDAHLGRCGTE
jgi:acyl-CoA reductase-like NAD-dependent aldehyde dehydrogenase